jgi:hypothetical protein
MLVEDESEGAHAAARAVIERVGGDDVVEALVALAPSELTSLMLHVAAQRASRAQLPGLLTRHRRDRFTRPTPVPARAIRAAEDRFVEALAADFELVALAPLAPFAVHAALTGISQNRLVTTMRNNEVAGDPTVGLVLEAALRRTDPATRALTPRLAAVQRITRAQQFSGPASFAHFTLGALVTVGRDRGNHEFEVTHFVEHLAIYTRLVASIGGAGMRVALTDFSGRRDAVMHEVARRSAEQLGIDVHRDDERAAGRGYYPGICFKIAIDHDGGGLEIGDGGFVDWAARLTGNRKEHCLTSGASLERLALLIE